MNWTIIGCGWLGASLGEVLVHNDHSVIGTTTTFERQEVLVQKGIKNVFFNLNSQISTEIIDLSDVVVLSIPPFNRNDPNAYGEALLHLVKQFHSKTKFIFLGSIGIYPQKNAVFQESYHFDDVEKSTSLYQAEKKLSDYLKNRLTILRLGGLFGNDRHPIYSLSGKTNIKNPDGKINFAGQKDIISAIQLIEKHDAFGEVFNIVYPSHPLRKEYYAQKAKELNLDAPEFDDTSSIVREISSAKIQNKLGLIFEQTI